MLFSSLTKNSIPQVARLLFVVSFCFFVLGVIHVLDLHLWGELESLEFLDEFNVNEEYNLPAFFSAFLLLYASALLARIAILNFRKRHFYQWLCLSITFLYLAIDETFSLHEDMKYARRILGINKGNPLYDDAWIFIGIAFIVVFLLIFWRFVNQQTRKNRTLLFISAGLYIFGALGLEIIGGYWQFFQGKDLIHGLLASLEELLEMLGISLFIATLLGIVEESRSSLKPRTRL